MRSNKLAHRMLSSKLLAMVIALLCSNASFAAQSVAIQGRLLNSDGSPVTSSSVQFTVKVKSPGAEDCLLYQETQTLNLSQTAGAFALTLGSGTRAASTVDGGNPLNTVFSNSSAISLSSAPSACANLATSFTPGSSDTRNLEITFNDGSGVDSIPTIPLAWTPQSIYSQDAGKLAGINATQYLKVATGATPTTLSVGDYSNFVALLNGTSTQYMSSSATAGTVVPNLSSAPTTPASGQMWFDSVTNTIKYYNGTATQTIGTSSGLSSVGLSMPTIFSVTGSPLTANGSITATLATQTANTVFAGPSSGGAAAPTFRALTSTDLPIAAAGGILKDGGNSLGAAMTLGTNDAYSLGLKTNNSTRMTIDSSGNVGVGTTAPNASLDVNGSITLTGGNNKIWALNSGTNFLRLFNTSNNGVDLSSNTIATFSTAGSERARIDASGNVGIGTTAPGVPLEVHQDANANNFEMARFFNSNTGASAVAGINIKAGSSNYGGLLFSRSNNAASEPNSFSVINYNNAALRFGVNNGENMRIDANGNVGIGMTAPTDMIHIKVSSALTDGGVSIQPYSGSSQAKVNFLTTGGAGNWSIGSYGTSNNFVISNGTALHTAPKFVVAPSTGNVGIGTTTPGSLLELSSGSAPTIRQTNTTATSTWSSSVSNSGVYTLRDETNSLINFTISAGGAAMIGGGSSAGLSIVRTGGASNEAGLSLSTNGATTMQMRGISGGGVRFTTAGLSEWMRIDSNGNVGIGTTGPSYKLDVAGDINTSTCFRIGATTVSGTCTSDSRLKDNVQDYTAGLSDLLNIRLRTYTFNGLGEMPKTGEVAVGVIAQEVEKTNPELVKTRMVKMQPDDSEKTEIKAVDYSKFSFMLINAVKELYQKWFYDHSEIQLLKESNLLLKNQIRGLASENEKKDQIIEKLQTDSAQMKSYLCQKDVGAQFCL